jgi:hypothetical protein
MRFVQGAKYDNHVVEAMYTLVFNDAERHFRMSCGLVKQLCTYGSGSDRKHGGLCGHGTAGKKKATRRNISQSIYIRVTESIALPLVNLPRGAGLANQIGQAFCLM